MPSSTGRSWCVTGIDEGITDAGLETDERLEYVNFGNERAACFCRLPFWNGSVREIIVRNLKHYLTRLSSWRLISIR